MEYDFPVTAIRLACFVPAGTGEAVHHDRPSHGVALHLSGQKRYCFRDGTVLHVTGGQLIYLPKGSDYTVRTSESGDCYAVNFDMAGDAAFAPFVVTVRNVTELTEAYRDAVRAWKGKQAGYRTRCKELLYHVLFCLQQEYARAGYLPSSLYARIDPAVTMIRERACADTPSVAELAAACAMSPEYFRAVFRRRFGTSPLCYINLLRLTNARELILSGMYSVTEAAALSGYADLSHFSRAYRKQFGVPPSRQIHLQ